MSAIGRGGSRVCWRDNYPKRVAYSGAQYTVTNLIPYLSGWWSCRCNAGIIIQTFYKVLKFFLTASFFLFICSLYTEFQEMIISLLIFFFFCCCCSCWYFCFVCNFRFSNFTFTYFENYIFIILSAYKLYIHPSSRFNYYLEILAKYLEAGWSMINYSFLINY